MKVFQKNWVRLLLLFAFCGTLIAAVYLDAATLWAKEVRLEEQQPAGPYRNSLIFKGVAAGRDAYGIEVFCAMAETQQSLQDKTIYIGEYGFSGESGTFVRNGKQEITWGEFLKSQGMEGIKLIESAEQELEGSIVSHWGDMGGKNDFLRISGKEFVNLLDTADYERLYSEEGMNQFSAEYMETNAPDGENVPDAENTPDAEYEEPYELYEYAGEFFSSVQEAYQAYAEGRLDGILNQCIDFDWDWQNSFVDNITSLRLYKAGDAVLLYDEKEGVLVGNRMQRTLLSEIEKNEFIYLIPKTVQAGSEEMDWQAVIVNGFTSSLTEQLRYEVFLSTGEWEAVVYHNDLKAVEVYKDGERFIDLGESGEDDVCISFTSKEELAYVFGKDSDVYKNAYEIYCYYGEDYFETPLEKLNEFLYEDCIKYGNRTGPALAVSLTALILAVLLLIGIVPALWKREEEKLRDRVLLEVNILFTIFVITGCCIAGYGAGVFLGDVGIRYFNTGGVLLGGAIILELLVLLGIAAVYQLVSTVVYRIRKRCFLKGWLAGRIIGWLFSKIKRVAKNMDILKRRVLYLVIIGAAFFIEMVILCVCAANSVGFVGVFGMFCYFVCLIGFSYVFLKDAMDNKRLLDGCNQMKSGMFDKKIDTTNLYYDKLELAQAINTMGEGLEKAVSTSMKDERMKAELITNVSHDIKTPLTSIINYVDLLKREGITPEEQQQYLKVLDTKSQRLKQLIEDLIEVSKTNTGNIELQLANLDFKELLNQAIGEFEEKFAERSLELVVTCAEHKVQIWADGRRCYRILENLFSNVYKYAMPHTRVYVDLQQEANQMVFTLKNISEAPLNVAVEELMERFVRGDVSRSTSGSGLGLSIAQNLVNLQQGKLEIRLDGDLFKVEIRFPIAQQ